MLFTNLLVVLMNFGSHVKKIYDTDLVKNKHIENSITPGINNASQIPIAFNDDDDDELDFVDDDIVLLSCIILSIVDTVFVDSSSDNFIVRSSSGSVMFTTRSTSDGSVWDFF